MTFNIDVNGHSRRVTVDAARGAPGRYTVRVDDVVHEVDARTTELGVSILYLASGRAVEVALAEARGGRWRAELPHVAIDAEVDGHRFARRDGGPAAAAGEQRIMSPMPGRVVRVLVKPGDAVEARQGLVIVEAMKMENELSSPRGGRVREVAVSEGASVESGRLLVVVE